MAESTHERVFLEERNGDRLDRKRVLQGLAILTWLRYYRGSVEGAVLSASKNRSRFRELAVCLSRRTFQRIAIIKRTPFRRKRIYSYIIAPSRTNRVITVRDIHVETLEILQSILFCWKRIYVAFPFSFFCKKQRKETGDLYLLFSRKIFIYKTERRYNCNGSLENRKIQNNWRKNDSRNVIGLERNKRCMQISAVRNRTKTNYR